MKLKPNFILLIMIFFQIGHVYSQHEPRPQHFEDEDSLSIQPSFKQDLKGLYEGLTPKEREELLIATQQKDTTAINRLSAKMFKSFLKSGKKIKVKKIAKKILAMFKPMNINQVENILRENSKGKPLEGIYNFSPKFLTFNARMLKDEEATTSFFEIINKRLELLIFLIINIFFFIIGWLLNRNRKKNGPYSLFSNLEYKARKFIIINGIRFGIMYFLFRENLEPGLKILLDVLV